MAMGLGVVAQWQATIAINRNQPVSVERWSCSRGVSSV